MSDNTQDIAKRFEENVLRSGHPRNFGLFPIPEYPEFEADRGMWSAAFNAILTTLRYLAPATLLTLFWGQQSFLFKLLKGIDSAFRAIVYSSEEQKQEVLQWLAEAGPVRVEHLDTVWRHGWILCGVLDAALPGACSGHTPTRLSLKHAQTIADHYLGVEPVFSRQELESNEALSRHQEWKLATYIDRIRKALAKLTPAVSKPTSQRTSPETQVTFDYVARGSGLAAAQVNNKMYFKVYPTSQQSMEPGEINVLIRGPKDTYGMTVVPPIFGKAQLIRQKLLGFQQKPIYTETALPLTQGATYMRTFGKNDMNKTYYIPKTTYDIEIEVEQHEDYAVISYTVMLEGKYEILITSRGQNIVGSPFSMISSKNILGTLEKESFCLEDGEEISIVDVKSDRKVVLRIVDFVTEKMLLRENGTFEKITDTEANILMSMDYTPSDTPEESITCSVASSRSDDFKKLEKFNKAACKVVQMNRVCKIINSLLAEKRKREKAFIRPISQQSIPDIVNSTFSEVNINTFRFHEKRDKLIVPENISVSLQTEKNYPKEDIHTNIEEDSTILNASIEIDTPDSLEKFETISESEPTEDVFLTSMRNSSSNPFLNHIYEPNFMIEKDLGSFVKTEYEANKSGNEETAGDPIKIVIETADISHSPSPTNVTNPFVEPDIVAIERPKTPVLKIITGEVNNREDSVFVNPKVEELFSEETLANEFVNPFFLHHHKRDGEIPVTDFIIGAPVSMPPIIRASTPEPNMDSIIITDDIQRETKEKDEGVDDESSSVFSTPLHTTLNKFKENKNVDNSPSLFYSLDSTTTDNVDILSLSDTTDNKGGPYQQSRSERDVTTKKDTWDSAYVSIDDSNSSPDNNNNDNNPLCENHCKQKFSLSDIEYEYTKMGPAEREIWESCYEINESKHYEEPKSKWEAKRPTFTPILEESDRSISTGMKDALRSDSSSNAVAFAELNDNYHNLFTTSNSSPAIHKNQDMNYTIERKKMSVDSASEPSDVKRHAENSEGKISEVQANVTESASVSQTLHKLENMHVSYLSKNKDETQFGDENKTNIVLEKKQYWDERIREIQAKFTEEDKTQQKRKRLSARHLRQNDSLTKRRGKQIVKNFLNTGEQFEKRVNTETKSIEIINRKSPISHESPDKVTDAKLVEKWKNYWDNKLQSDKDDSDTNCFRTKSPKSKASSVSPQLVQYSSKDFIEEYKEPLANNFEASIPPVKQELSEEVFKAFETSPKRFFGTSRKQILNKIDTFLGKPGTADESSPELSGAGKEYDTGLVSSRISLFHTISKTEELPWARRKCQSMHNIFQRKDSERSIPSVKEDGNTNDISEKKAAPNKTKLERKYVTIDAEEIRQSSGKDSENIHLKDKRARLVQNIHNKSFDDSLYTKLPQPHNTVKVQTSTVKKTITEYNKHSEHRQRFSTHVLRKSSVSKSEMDIFSKITNKPVEDDLDKYKSCDELPKINVKSFISLYESVSKDVKMPVKQLTKTREMRLQRLSQSNLRTGAASNLDTTYITRKFNKPASETDESMTDLTHPPTNHWNKDPDSISSGSYEPRSLDSVDVEIIPLKNIAKNTTYVSLSDIELEIVENAVKSNEPVQPKEETEENSVDYKSRFKMAKQFFQSLEDVREIKKPKKLNECERLLLSESSESLVIDKEPVRPQRRVKKNIKSHSMPSSEITKIWNQLQESQNDPNKLVKISEKFNVDDLFNDVMEGRLSRQGSLRGIPHKKAVLEAFRSMENLTNKNISYEIAATQLTDFAKENQIKNAQTYLTEYPYLPTTAPSKYHSRLDTKATGLISYKELHNQKPRRNSVPDLRIKPFTVQL